MNKKIRAFCCFWIAFILLTSGFPPVHGAVFSPEIPYGKDIGDYRPDRDGYYGYLPVCYEVPGSEITEDCIKTTQKVNLPVLVYGKHLYADAGDLPQITGLTLKTGASGICFSFCQKKLYLTPGSDEAYLTVGEPDLFGRYYINIKFRLSCAVLEYDGVLWVPFYDICLLFDLKPNQTTENQQDYFSIFQPREDVTDVLAELYSNSAAYAYQYSGGDLNTLYASSGIVQVINGLFEGDPDAWAMYLKCCFFMDDWAQEGWEKAMTEEVVLDILQTGKDETLKLMNECLKFVSDEFALASMSGEGLASFTGITSSRAADEIYSAIHNATREWYRNTSWYNEMFQKYNSKIDFSHQMREVSTEFKNFGDAMDKVSLGVTNFIGVLSYWQAFQFRDRLAASGLEKAMEQKENFHHLGKSSIAQLEKSLTELKSDALSYTVFHYIKDNFLSWIADGINSECPPLAAYRLAMHLIPWLREGIDATRSFQVSMYAIPLQMDIRNVLLEHLDSYNGAFPTAEELKESIELAYAYLKTCYTARNLAISALSGNGRDQTAEIGACTGILDKLAILSANYSEDTALIFPSDLTDLIRNISLSDDSSILPMVKALYVYAEGEVRNRDQDNGPVEDAECEITSDGNLLGTFSGTPGGNYAVYVPLDRPRGILPADLDLTKKVSFSFTSPTVEGEDCIGTTCDPGEEIRPVETAYLGAERKVTITVSQETIEESYFTSSIITPVITIPSGTDAAKAITESGALKDMVDSALKQRDTMAEEAREFAANSGVNAYFCNLKLFDACCAGDALSMQFMESEYYGGAHPLSMRFSHTFDLNTGEELTLSDLTDPENPRAEEELISLFTQALKETLKGYPQPESAIRGVFEGEYNYNLWHFTQEGLQISFAPYVIAQYGAGYIEPVVPYGKLHGILRSEYLPSESSREDSSSGLKAASRPDGQTCLTSDGPLRNVVIGNGYNEYSVYRTDILFYSNIVKEGELIPLPESAGGILIGEYGTTHPHAVCITSDGGAVSLEPVTLTD